MISGRSTVVDSTNVEQPYERHSTLVENQCQYFFSTFVEYFYKYFFAHEKGELLRLPFFPEFRIDYTGSMKLNNALYTQ